MIRLLDVEEYCHDCPDFEPAVQKKKNECNMVVYCKYYKTCQRFMTYLKSQLTKEKGESK